MGGKRDNSGSELARDGWFEARGMANGMAWEEGKTGCLAEETNERKDGGYGVGGSMGRLHRNPGRNQSS